MQNSALTHAKLHIFRDMGKKIQRKLMKTNHFSLKTYNP